jgi:hypothetical protein
MRCLSTWPYAWPATVRLDDGEAATKGWGYAMALVVRSDVFDAYVTGDVVYLWFVR